MKFAPRPRGSAVRRRSPLALALVLGVLGLSAALLAPLPSALAQTIAAATGPTVRDIDIQYVGRATITRERILANMRTAVGQPFSQNNVEDDIRSLYATGDFSNVRVFGEPVAGGVKVIVIVATKASIKDVVFVGNVRLKTRRLKTETKLKKNDTLDEEMVEQARQKLLDYYHDKGFNDAAIKSDITLDETANTGVVTFTITEGGPSSLDHVIFEGNKAISSRVLRPTMKGTRGKTFYSFIDKSGRLDQTKLQEDLNSIRELYQEKGYVDIEIKQTRVDRLPKGDINLVIVLFEGPQYHVNTISFEGTQIFTDAEIRRFLKMKEGSVYSAKSLSDDKKTIRDYYGSRGYADSTVVPEGNPAGPALVNLKYKVSEGGQSFINKINIAGNTQTKDKVIRREIPLAPGDVYNTVLVEAAKKRLENLGYFEKVDTNDVQTVVADRKDLDVLVQEKRTGAVSFGAGFSSIDSLVGQLELTQSNFDITNIHGFTGGGQRFRALLQYGVTRKDFVLSLTEPNFLDSRLSVGGEAFYHDTNYISNDYNQQNLGFDLNVRRGLTRFTAASLEYRIENVNISDVQTNSTILQQEVGTRVRSGLRAGYSFDSRDGTFLTRRGTRIDFSPYIAGSFLGGSTEIYGFDLTGAQYFPLPGDTILLFNGEVATVDTYNGGDRVPVYDRLYLGGPNSLRGFGFRKVGPLDYKGNPVGGRTLVRFTAEYTYPIIKKVRGAFFYDGGFVNQDSWDFAARSYHNRSDYRFDPNRRDTDPKTPKPNPTGDDLKYTEFGGGFNMDVGIGLRLDLPIGPIRLDYGYPLLSNDFNERHSGKFNFNVGYQF